MMSADQPRGDGINEDARPITVRVKANGLDEVFGRFVVGGIEASARLAHLNPPEPAPSGGGEGGPDGEPMPIAA